MAAKKYDIVIYGATGFTGELVTRYFLTNDETSLSNVNGLKWAIAGRSQDKMDNLKQKLKDLVPSVDATLIDKIPSIQVDCYDASKIEEMVKQTKVVLTVVGPYMKYGSILVQKCAENGVHYCDLTGELLWVEEMMGKYQAIAEKTGAKLIPCCGFESVPSDLTSFLIADFMKTKLKTACEKVCLYILEGVGGVSGGTCASMFNLFEKASSKDLARSSGPFFLTDSKTQIQKQNLSLVKPNSPSVFPRYEKDLQKWSSMFIGSTANSTIVHRSNYLLKNHYGDKFVYRERSAVGGLFLTILSTIATSLIGIAVFFRPTRALLKWIAPAPGQGPSEETMKNGYFNIKAFGYNPDDEVAVQATVRGYGDPGYSCTSKMIAECAQCLAKNETSGNNVKGGFLTPASAFGAALAKRLEAKKIITFEVKEA